MKSDNAKKCAEDKHEHREIEEKQESEDNESQFISKGFNAPPGKIRPK
jgi:hypothetical protein